MVSWYLICYFYFGSIDFILASGVYIVSVVKKKEHIKNKKTNKINKKIMSREKRALLIGINYVGTRSQLQGCINDVLSIKDMLIRRGFKEQNITILTDNTQVKPTKTNILTSLQTFCTQPNSELFFHYSGHGSQISDRNSDEGDGKDECLCPLDYPQAGFIVDDQIRLMINSVPSTSNLFCLFDCCHSGTICDLPFNIVNFKGANTFARNNRYAETSGNVMMLSGCQDPQVSIDARFEGKNQGALTFSFLCAVDKMNVKTWTELYEKVLKILKMFKMNQLPHLSSGKNISCNSSLFGL